MEGDGKRYGHACSLLPNVFCNYVFCIKQQSCCRESANKLTMEHFNSISDQIIQWANKSENENNGQTFIPVIHLVFKKATDEATWSEMYVKLYWKMQENISSNIQDDNLKNVGAN